jgi:choline dehydrogenase-like flavoprotein
MSEPSPELGGLSVGVLVGKVVGGGSVINGMAFDRAAVADYDAWERLGNPGWGWKGLLPYFRKSTTFTPPKYTAEEFNITWDASAYGTTGPLQASFPNYDFPTRRSHGKLSGLEDTPHPKNMPLAMPLVRSGFLMLSTQILRPALMPGELITTLSRGVPT